MPPDDKVSFVRRLLLLLVLPVLLLLAACGSGSSDTESSTALPAVEGAYGDKPTVAIPAGDPGAELVAETLSEGDGDVVEKGDLLVVDYLGQTWRADEGGEANVFDNSYDRGTPVAFPIGVGGVIPGWDEGLVGIPVGSRVELIIPPDKGYGTEGQPAAGISGDETLVFVVDLIATYGPDATADTTATPQPAVEGLPAVSGELGQRPTVAIPPGSAAPTAASATVLAQGAGAPVAAGKLAILQYEAVSWSGQPVGSSWEAKVPAGVAVAPQDPSAAATPSPFDSLVGVPVGSRVLLLFPADEGQDAATASGAAVVDVVAQHGPAGS